MQAYYLNPRVPQGALVRLERSAVKVARCVLRGLGEGDLAWLPGGLWFDEPLHPAAPISVHTCEALGSQAQPNPRIVDYE